VKPRSQQARSKARQDQSHHESKKLLDHNRLAHITDIWESGNEEMSQSDQLSRLAATDVPEPDLPPLPWVPLPDKLVRAFDLGQWQEQMIAAQEKWIDEANYLLRNASQ
jgi:hypothetical protein